MDGLRQGLMYPRPAVSSLHFVIKDDLEHLIFYRTKITEKTGMNKVMVILVNNTME